MVTREQAGKVTCPVCGREADPGVAPSLQHGGRTYYFECQRCLQRFLLAPELFVGCDPTRQAGTGGPASRLPSRETERGEG